MKTNKKIIDEENKTVITIKSFEVIEKEKDSLQKAKEDYYKMGFRDICDELLHGSALILKHWLDSSDLDKLEQLKALLKGD